MKTILYTASSGYGSRNLLKVGVLEQLLSTHKDLRVVIVTPAYNDADFINGFSFSDQIFFEKMADVDHVNGFLDKVIGKLWCLGQNKLFFKHLYQIVLKVPSNKQPFRKHRHLYTSLFDKYKPDLVIGASVGGIAARGDFPILLEAKKRSIRTLILINSWDNIALRRGPMIFRPDYLGVWNENQKEDAIQAHFYDPKKVRLVGPPQFDFYWRKETFQEREEFFKKMNLDPKKKLISVMATVSNLVKNNYIIDILLEALHQNKFKEPVQLLFRPQPSYVRELNHAEYAKYYNRSDIVIDNRFDEMRSKLGWAPDKQQLMYFANLIQHTDVQVTIVSTSTIEAAILNKPVVNVAFSTIEPELFREKILESVYLNHYRPVVKSGGTYMAHTPQDLIQGINEYLTNPQLHKEGRERLVKEIVHGADGRSLERVCQTIMSLL